MDIASSLDDSAGYTLGSSATQRDRYIQRAHQARQATVANMAAHGIASFELTEWSGRTFSTLAEQWPRSDFDWPRIRENYRDPDRLDVAIWSKDRLSGLFLATLAGESVTLRWVEGDPREDCPLIGKRLLIALDAAVNYTQINGRYELRVEPINDKLINLFETDFGFKAVNPRKGSPYWAKQV